MDETIKDFEAALAELAGIVKKLEDGDLALEASLGLYERGVQLQRYCHERLEAAERRIDILNDRGELVAAPRDLTEVGQDEDRAQAFAAGHDAVAHRVGDDGRAVRRARQHPIERLLDGGAALAGELLERHHATDPRPGRPRSGRAALPPARRGR